VKGAYYNEIDPYAAQWLRNLIAAGHIAAGDVDERSIVDVRADDLRGYVQCHFFAGIGVWSYALRLAGWPDDEPVWSGSCPCQPFSSAGQGKGHEDQRHLWPAWYGLIRESRPDAFFGEQVADGDGYAWLDDVGHDVESIGYAIGALCPTACGVGAPHERQRLYFVGHPIGAGSQGRDRPGHLELHRATEQVRPASPAGLARRLEHAYSTEQDERAPGGEQPLRDERTASAGTVEQPESEQAWISRLARQQRATGGFWADAEWVYCGDDSLRPVEPGTFPMANGIASRMDKVRAYGNAIVAPVAAEFIRAYREQRSG
jgi:DNA (cytosine-5)-methyltransferase 1